MITVARSGRTDNTSVVRYFTSDGSATQRSDYTFAAGTLTFRPGETQKKIPLLISDDAYAEGIETMNITLVNTRGASLGSPATATLQILDNDRSDGSANPIDDPSILVGEHYHDFLNRQSDANGQNFWAQQIASCGNDQQCIEQKRINVSAAFYLSISWQGQRSNMQRTSRPRMSTRAAEPRRATTRPAIHPGPGRSAACRKCSNGCANCAIR